jgi:hypothetical protein
MYAHDSIRRAYFIFSETQDNENSWQLISVGLIIENRKVTDCVRRSRHIDGIERALHVPIRYSRTELFNTQKSQQTRI